MSQVRRQYEQEVQQPGAERRFELTTSLSLGSSASAKIVGFNNLISTWQTSTVLFTVWDALGHFEADAGTKGRARWHGDSRRWEIFELGC